MATTTSTPGTSGPDDEGSAPGTTPETAINSCAAPPERSTASTEAGTIGPAPIQTDSPGGSPAVLTAFAEPNRVSTGAQALFYAVTSSQEHTDRAIQLMAAATATVETIAGQGGEKVMREVRKTFIAIACSCAGTAIVIMGFLFGVNSELKINSTAAVALEGVSTLVIPGGSFLVWKKIAKTKREVSTALQSALTPHQEASADGDQEASPAS